MMYGATVKHFSHEPFGNRSANIYLSSVMSCMFKKGESDHEAFIDEGIRDVDNEITTKDLGDLLRLHDIDRMVIVPLPYNSPF